MDLVAHPSGLFLANNLTYCKDLCFEIGAPLADDALHFGNFTTPRPENQACIASLDWDTTGAAELRLILPQMVGSVVLPNAVNGPQAHATQPFNALVAKASFYETSCSFFVIDPNGIRRITNTVLERGNSYNAIAIDGIWRAVAKHLSK